MKHIAKIAGILCLVIGFFIFGKDLVRQNKITKPLALQIQKQLFTQAQSFAPLFSSKLTPTPTPTDSDPHNGFCLFVPVLMYHHVQPEAVAMARGQGSLTVDPTIFDQQMNYLVTHGYSAISAQNLVNALIHHTPLPAKSVVITLDDGYEDNFEYAYPIFQKYHLIANEMVATGLLGGVGNNTYYTWDQLSQMVGSGLIFTTDHTWSHFSMGTSTSQKDQFEIMTAKDQLESHLGTPQTIFTYPYGTGASNTRVIKELQQDGFVAAFSTIGGSWQCDGYIYALRRTRIGNTSLAAYGF